MDLIRRLFGKSSAKSTEKLEQGPAESRPPDEEKSPQQPSPGSATAVEQAASVDEEEGVEPTVQLPPSLDGATRPLPPELSIALKNGHLLFGQASDIGMVRSNNQDSALSFYFTSQTVEDRPDFGLFIVADGMGGHHDGEKASALTARMVARTIMNSVYLPSLSGDNDANLPTITEALIDAAKKANAAVMKDVPNGGTTLTAVAVMGDLAHIVHIGDSRGYVITKDGVEQITRDHSLVQRLIELDQLTREEAEDHPQKNVLYRAIGQSETLEVDTLTRRLPSNSYMLLCSDGLWGQVTEEQIFEIVLGAPTPQSACDKLVALANSRGGIDNITAILLKVPGR